MYQTTVGVDGMMCGMCEAHVNDAVRKAFPVKKVTSSHGRGQTVILSEQALDEQAVRGAINATGYTVTKIMPGRRLACASSFSVFFVFSLDNER